MNFDLSEFLLGLKHSLTYYTTAQTMLKIKEAHKPMFYSFFLTGIIFLGSIFIYNLISDTIFKDSPILERTFIRLFYIFWLIPVYIFCFILNIFCYSDIASATFKLIKGKPVFAAVSFSRGLACEIHRGLIMGVYILFMTILSFVPYSDVIIICLMSWLYSFYCFEYRWMFEGKTIVREIKTIECNALYYLGFGMPFALITYSFPGFVGNGIWALVFPVFSVTAILANPPTEPSRTLPVFRLVHKLCDRIEVLVFNTKL